MPRCTKDLEIELSDGTVVECRLMVYGTFEETFNQDLGIEEGSWLVGTWAVEYDDTISEAQQEELDEKIEETVFAEKWDFENATDDDEDEDEAEE
jgi:hypothetical protein